MDIWILLTFALVCAVSDLKTNRIPNPLILCGLAGALLFRLFPFFSFLCASLVQGGSPDWPALGRCFLDLADGCAGGLLPWLFFGVLAALRMIGGGDVKLLSVIGLQLGAAASLTVMWYSLLIAALWSVVLVIRRHNLLTRLQYLYQYVGRLASGQKPGAYRTGLSDRSGEFCFALPVLFALTFYICMHTTIPVFLKGEMYL